MRNSNKKIKAAVNFAIVIDGECEDWYFQMLKRNERSLSISIEPKIPQRKSLKDQYDSVIELSKDYAKVFWILDFDVVNKEVKERKNGKNILNQLHGYFTVIKGKFKNVVIVVNNPCLEYWYLLHYKKTNKYYEDFSSLERDLQKYMPDYAKSREFYTRQGHDIYLKLKTKLADAIDNSKSIDPFSLEHPHVGCAEMHLVIEELKTS